MNSPPEGKHGTRRVQKVNSDLWVRLCTYSTVGDGRSRSPYAVVRFVTLDCTSTKVIIPLYHCRHSARQYECDRGVRNPGQNPARTTFPSTDVKILSDYSSVRVALDHFEFVDNYLLNSSQRRHMKRGFTQLSSFLCQVSNRTKNRYLFNTLVRTTINIVNNNALLYRRGDFVLSVSFRRGIMFGGILSGGFCPFTE